MSPPEFTIDTANQSPVSYLQIQVPQEVHVASNISVRRESTDGRKHSNTYVLKSAPTPQNLSHVLSEDYVEVNESSHSKSYSNAWSNSKSIQQSILSFGSYSEDHSCVLTIALKHKSLKDIVDQMGYILPK